MPEPRLCVVSPLYHPSLGGLGRQAMLLTERLAARGIKVFVIARRMDGMPPAAFAPSVTVHRAWSLRPRVHHYERVGLRNILISLSFSLSCALLLVRKRKEFDIAHFHGASLPLFLNLPLLKLLRKKVVAKVAAANIGTEAGSLRGRYLGMGSAVSRMLRSVDVFIATSAEIEEGLGRDGLVRVRRIPNFVDTAEFRPAAGGEKNALRERLVLGTGKIVVFSGRFDQRKGIVYLLEAWKIAASAVPDARLLLLGDGPLLRDMKDRAASLNIASSVVFNGRVENVPDLLRASDVFVLPSLQEGMPNALLEAMACGLPPVATRIGGVTDIVRDRENGLLVQPRDAKGLAEGIVSLLKDDSLGREIGRGAFRTITDSYALDSIAARYVMLYRELLR